MAEKKQKTERQNSRIFVEQKKFIRDLSKKTGKSEGEITREIIQFYIDNQTK